MQMGSLRVSCFIIGKNELPPVHKDGDDEENQTLSRQAMIEKQRENQGLEIINAPTISHRSFQLIVKIYKVDGLPEFNTNGSERYWLKVRTQGCEQLTVQVERERSEWN